MAADTKELLIELKMQNKQLIKSVSETDSKLGKLNTQQKKTGKSLSALKAGYVAVAAVLTGLVAKAFSKALGQASAFEEANSKFGVVFRGVSKEANTMRNELVSSYGVSTLAATEMLSGIQDFLVPMGIARGEASELSGQFSKLAVDIGSFNNAPTAEVMDAIKSALSGMALPLRRFGVDVSETTLKQMAMARGMTLVNGKIDRQQRAQLLLSKITQDSSDAMGDFARTQNSTANIMKRAQAIVEDLTLVFGQQLAKEIQPVVDEFNEFLKTPEGLAKIKRGVEGIFVAFKILIIPIQTTISQVKFLVKNAFAAGKGLKSLFQAIATRDIGAAKQAVKDLGTDIVDNTKTMVDEHVSLVKNAAKNAVGLFREIDAEAIEGVNNIVGANEEGGQRLVDQNKLTKEQIKETNALFRESEKEAEDQTLEEKLERINILLEAVKAGSDEEDKLLQAKVVFQKLLEEERRKEASITHNLLKKLTTDEVQATQKALSDISGMTSSSNKTLFKIGKAAGIADATISAAQAVLKTMASVPYPVNIPLAVAQAAAGTVQVNRISNTKFVGKQRGGVVDNVMGSPINGEDGMIGVQRGEGILTRDAVVNLGRETINRINASGGQGGLKPSLIVNVMNGRPEETVQVLNDYMRQFGTSDQGEAI